MENTTRVMWRGLDDTPCVINTIKDGVQISSVTTTIGNAQRISNNMFVHPGHKLASETPGLFYEIAKAECEPQEKSSWRQYEKPIAVKCNDGTEVIVENSVGVHGSIFQRDDGPYAICYTYSSGSRKTVFVNLETKEQFVYPINLYISSDPRSVSPNSNYVIVYLDSRTRAGGSPEVTVYDITDMHSPNIIFREQSEGLFEEYYFDKHSQFVCEYNHEFYKYEYFVTSSYAEICDVVGKEKFPDYNESYVLKGDWDSELWRAGVEVFENEKLKVVRKFNPGKVTPFALDKGKSDYSYIGFAEQCQKYVDEGMDRISAHNRTTKEYGVFAREFYRQHFSKYGTYCFLDEMETVEVICSERFRNNQQYVRHY